MAQPLKAPFSISHSIVQPDPAAVHDQAGWRSTGSLASSRCPEQRMQVVSVAVFALNRAYFFALVNKQLPLPASSAHQDSGELPPGGQAHSFAGTV